jgi:two-component system, OmpR family, sensor histidine kinase KdpD
MLTVVITLIAYEWAENLGFTGIAMLYLLLVVGVAYHYSPLLTVIVAFTSFFVMNYFFVEPRFTYQVGHIASWASLISFLIVSFVVTSLVKRLKRETFESQQAYCRAEFLRKLAEKLAYADNIQIMLEDCQDLLQNEFNLVALMVRDGAIVKGNFELTIEQKNAINWVQANGQSFGAGTGNWTDSNFMIVPFNRLKSNDPVLFIPQVSDLKNTNLVNTIKLAVDQIAVAYQHLLQKQKTLQAENQASEEAIRAALLASIAHDMRTPLTAILGAATTLNQADLTFNTNEIQHLTTLISSQAKHLARTTENILSLVRLESVSKDAIVMDIQSPEEIVGILADLYQYQTTATQLSIKVNQPDLLIKANGDLVVLALTNLIENAKQANIDNNQPHAAIEVIAGESDGKVFIQVCDQGRGFADGFDASQIKKFESSRDKGFGLGLSIVEAVANLHQAELVFDKGKNNGAVVSLRFSKPKVDLAYVG